MFETDYRHDIMITWTSEEDPKGMQEGFDYDDLVKYNGSDTIERVNAMFYEFNINEKNHTRKRIITKIELISIKTIFEKK